MKKLFTVAGSVALLSFFISTSRGADAAKPDAEGYIRNWLMLAPINLPDEGTPGDFIAKDQIKDEAGLKPKEGEKAKVGDQELTWKSVTARTNFFDLNETLNSDNDRKAGYMVAYIESDQEMADVTLAISSNDQGRLYLNGKEVFTHAEARTLDVENPDKVKGILKKGVNVIVFKVINENNNWQGALRFLDKAGAPIKNLKVRTSP